MEHSQRKYHRARLLHENGHGGVVIGSEISGGYRNLFVENCRMDSPDLDRVIRIKTSTCRGGLIENVFVRNVTVGQCREAVLRINLQYETGKSAIAAMPLPCATYTSKRDLREKQTRCTHHRT